MDEEDEDGWTIFSSEDLTANPPAFLAYLDAVEGFEEETRRAWVFFLYVANCGWPKDDSEILKIDRAVKYLKDGPRLKSVK